MKSCASMSKQTDWSCRGDSKSTSSVEGRRLVCIKIVLLSNPFGYTNYTDWGHAPT